MPLTLSEMPILSEKQLNNFLGKIEKTDNCWLFKGKISKRGYGYSSFNGRSYSAHRLAYHILIGNIPDKMLILHKCDVRNCVNPEHLFIGNQSDNMYDMYQKGRYDNKGERNSNSKLNSEQVLEIRKMYKEKYTLKTIAKKFNISIKQISNIINYNQWKNI